MQDQQTTLTKSKDWGRPDKVQNVSSERSFKISIAPMGGVRTTTIERYYGGNKE